MRISDWSSDVCSSDLQERPGQRQLLALDGVEPAAADTDIEVEAHLDDGLAQPQVIEHFGQGIADHLLGAGLTEGEAPQKNVVLQRGRRVVGVGAVEGHRVRRLALQAFAQAVTRRSEENTSELQSLMRISYSVFCFTTKTHS